jgi:hypothetical protein
MEPPLKKFLKSFMSMESFYLDKKFLQLWVGIQIFQLFGKELINLELSVQEINLILQALGQAPYVQVAELFEKIKVQAVPQVEALPKEEVAEAA